MAVIRAGQRGKKGTIVTKQQAGAAEAEALDYVLIMEDNSRQIAEAINKAIATALEEMGLAAERFAKGNLTRNHSVDTGRLRNSVTHALDMGEQAVYIGTNVEYGPYVELGTSRSAAKPYLEPAASEHKPFYDGVMRKHMSNA